MQLCLFGTHVCKDGVCPSSTHPPTSPKNPQWGPLAWVVPAELFPQRLRGKGMTLTTLANWLTNFAIAKAVPLMIQPDRCGD